MSICRQYALIVAERRPSVWPRGHRRQRQTAEQRRFWLWGCFWWRRIRFRSREGVQPKVVSGSRGNVKNRRTSRSSRRNRAIMKRRRSSMIPAGCFLPDNCWRLFFRFGRSTMRWQFLRTARQYISHCDLCGWCRPKAADRERKNHRLQAALGKTVRHTRSWRKKTAVHPASLSIKDYLQKADETPWPLPAVGWCEKVRRI